METEPVAQKPGSKVIILQNISLKPNLKPLVKPVVDEENKKKL